MNKFVWTYNIEGNPKQARIHKIASATAIEKGELVKKTGGLVVSYAPGIDIENDYLLGVSAENHDGTTTGRNTGTEIKIYDNVNDIFEYITKEAITATGGSTTTFIDSNLKFENDDDLEGGYLELVNCQSNSALNGKRIKINSYDKDTGTITFAEILSSTLTSGDTAYICPGSKVINSYNFALNSDGTGINYEEENSSICVVEIFDVDVSKFAVYVQFKRSFENLRKLLPSNLNDFEGTDVEKLQSAVDLCKVGNTEVVIDRDIDLTGYNINIDKGWPYYLIIRSINGAVLKKEDTGFMFTSSYDNSNRGNITFKDMNFEGNLLYEIYIANMTRMIAVFFNNCTFENLNCAKSTDKIQSLRLFSCRVYKHLGYFIDTVRMFDAHINSNEIEANIGQLNGGFVKVGSVGDTTSVIYLSSFNDNLYEGQDYPLFTICKKINTLTIRNSYFELINGGLIKIIDTTTAAAGLILLDGNFIGGSDVSIITGTENLNDNSKIIIKNNLVLGSHALIDNDLVVNDITIESDDSNLYRDYYGSSNNHLIKTNFTKLNIPNSTINNFGSVPVVSYTGGIGVTIEIDNFFLGENTSYAGKSMIVNIEQRHTTYMKGNFIGILSFTGVVATGNKIKMSLTTLFDEYGYTGTPATLAVTASFGNGTIYETNDNTVLTNKKIIFTLANATNPSATISIKPIDVLHCPSSTENYRIAYDEIVPPP